MKYLKYILAIVILIVFIIINKYIRIAEVVSNSMAPTVITGDKLIYIKDNFKINKNDIVLFKTKDGQINIKRCKALPKDTIYFFRGKYYYMLADRLKNEAEKFIIPYKGFTVNGDDYRKYKRFIENEKDKTNTLSHYTFEENYYYLRGDNLLNSIDSRDKGPVSESRVIGKYIMKF